MIGADRGAQIGHTELREQRFLPTHPQPHVQVTTHPMRRRGVMQPKAFATTTRVCDGYLTKNDQVLVATED